MFGRKKKEEPTKRWVITREFDISYACRVWTDYDDKRRRIHGQRDTVTVSIETHDSEHFEWIESFINEQLDLRFLLDLEDPWFAQITNAKPVFKEGNPVALSATQTLNTKEGREIKAIAVHVPETDKLIGYTLDVSDLSGPEKEFYEGFFLVHFSPTSENLTEWLYDCIQAKMSLVDVKVTRVALNETRKSAVEFQYI